jgi:hypothetical protein
VPTAACLQILIRELWRLTAVNAESSIDDDANPAVADRLAEDE